MHAAESFIAGVTRSWWLMAAFLLWLAVVQSVILEKLGRWLEIRSGRCIDCQRLRAIHVDATQRFLDFCDEIGLYPEEVAKRSLPMHELWTKTAHELEQHERTHPR